MNLYDYLDWRGDLSFKQAPFNEVDNLLLAYISYTVLDGLVREDEKLSLKEAASIFFKNNQVDDVRSSGSFIKESPFVLKRMSECERFKNCIIHDFVAKTSFEKTIQFSAMMVDLDDERTYVSFRGTDGTIIGWHEDLNITYETTYAQLEAIDYVNRCCVKNRDYVFGGHSKGGNLAVFAAMYCNEGVREKISLIYNNDGPGISDVAYNEEMYKAIEKKIVKIVPELDVIGVIYDRDKDPIIVKSDARLLMQHDALSWQIKGDRFERAAKPDDVTLLLAEIVSSFLKTATPLQCHIFSDSLFAAFAKAGIEDISQFQLETLRSVYASFKEILDINDEAKDVGRLFFDVVQKTLRKRILRFPDLIHSLLTHKDK